MKEMDLMRAMTDIDEQFIEEAAPAEKQEKRRLILPQAKQWLRGAAVMAVLLLSFTFITGRIGMGKGASGGSAPMLQQNMAADDSDSAPAESMEMAAGGAAAESVPEEAEEDAGAFNMDSAAATASIQLMCPQEYGDYVLAEVTYSESGAEAVYRNAQDETGLVITRRPSTEEEYRSSEPPVIYGEFKSAETQTTEAEWTEDGFTYHITVYDDVSEEEMQYLIGEIH